MMASSVDNISLLFLSEKWQFDSYGVSGIMRSLANDLWLTDIKGERIKMTCAIVKEDGKINKEEMADTIKYNVELRGAKQPRGPKKEPKLEWLNEYAIPYYQHLVEATNFDFIVGSMPFVTYGSLNLKDFYKNKAHSPKILLVALSLPKTLDGDVDEQLLLDWLREADIILSIGESIQSEISHYMNDLDDEEQPMHKLYIPGCPAELLTILQPQRKSPIQGPQNIAVMTQEKKHLDYSGLDFDLAVAASCVAAEQILLSCEPQQNVKMQQMILTSIPEERKEWEEHFNKLKESQPTRDKRLLFKFSLVEGMDQLRSVMKRCNLMLLPLKASSPLFGIEALMAAYSGVPILVSNNSGIASLLQSVGEEEAVVNNTTGNLQEDIDIWSQKIIQKISNPETAQLYADKLRGILILDSTVAASHISFIQMVTNHANSKVVIEFDVDDKIPDQDLEAAEKLGVKTNTRQTHSTDTMRYIATYLKKLLLQREKIELGVLDAYLAPGVKQTWQTLLSVLEEKRKKWLDVQEGSVVLTFFCPNSEAYAQLEDERWRRRVGDKLDAFLEKIGVRVLDLEPAVLVQNAHDVQESDVGPGIPPASKLNAGNQPGSPTNQQQDSNDTSQPAEREPIKTPENTTSLNEQRQGAESIYVESEGYGTISIDPLNEMALISHEEKMALWLSEVRSPTTSENGTITDNASGIRSEWHLLNSVNTGCPAGQMMSRFDVSESGHICMTHRDRENRVSLSVIYQSRQDLPVTLSSDLYTSPVFININGAESLAAFCRTDQSIHLWDIVKQTFKVVYKLDSEEIMVKSLCKIDGSTTALADWSPSGDVQLVSVLSTVNEPWSLTNILPLQPDLKGQLNDICYTSVDGCRCLLMCNVTHWSVSLVEMVGGRVRWICNRKQMGETCLPWGVCADHDDHVYVCDSGQHKVHVLSALDGAVLSTVLSAQQHFINWPRCVRIHNDNLYVLHAKKTDDEDKKWYVSVFRQE